MEKIELNAQARSAQSPKSLRKNGFIPAVIYGHNVKTESLEVSRPEFEKVFKKAGESTIITLNVNGGKPHNVIVHEAQRHYLSGKVQHIDFYEVSMTEKMTATVPLEFIGVSQAVKANGGILVTPLTEVEVECLPADLPQKIEVDISSLNTFEDAIHVRDLKVSDKVAIKAEPSEVVVKVSPPRDVEKELESQLGDVAAVEGVAEKAPEAVEGEAAADAEAAESGPEKK